MNNKKHIPVISIDLNDEIYEEQKPIELEFKDNYLVVTKDYIYLEHIKDPDGIILDEKENIVRWNVSIRKDKIHRLDYSYHADTKNWSYSIGDDGSIVMFGVNTLEECKELDKWLKDNLKW